MGEGGDGKGAREQHLCKLAKREEFDRIKQLVRDASHVCLKCGRAARDPGSLCKPSKL